jgi:hypothetical protein
MLTTIALFIVSVIIFLALFLVIVVVGIRQEPPTEELSEQASCLVAAYVRRLLGVHVRKPTSRSDLDQLGQRSSLARVAPLADTMPKPDPDDR